MTIHVDIVSAEGSIFSGEAERVFVPGKMGDLGIAPRHAPLLTTLRAGAVRVQSAVREHGHEMRLDLEDAARDVERLLALAGLHANRAGAQRRQ